MLIENGTVQISQSLAIMRHLARVHKLYGNSETEAIACDVLAETVLEYRDRFFPIAYGGGYPFGRQKREITIFLNQQTPPFLKALDALHPGKGPFFVTETPTFADFFAYEALDALLGLRHDILHVHPRLVAFVKAVRLLDGVKEYLPKQPPYDFLEYSRPDE